MKRASVCSPGNLLIKGSHPLQSLRLIFIIKNATGGLPWWSRGYSSTLPVQGPRSFPGPSCHNRDLVQPNKVKINKKNALDSNINFCFHMFAALMALTGLCPKMKRWGRIAGLI